MYRIAIVDDDKFFSDRINKITESYFREKGVDYEILVYKKSGDLLWAIQDRQYFDIYLMDIQMPGVDGLELAQAIRQFYDKPYIIFITSYMQHSIEAFELEVWRYIIKNSIEEKLPMAFETLLNKMNNKKPKFYVIEMCGSLTKIEYNDIYYIHKSGKYSFFVTAQGEIRQRKAITGVHADLADDRFIVTDKSYVVNLRHILNLNDHSIILIDGSIIPVSIAQYQRVKDILAEYWRHTS